MHLKFLFHAFFRSQRIQLKYGSSRLATILFFFLNCETFFQSEKASSFKLRHPVEKYTPLDGNLHNYLLV